jgi:N-acetylmuramoyl-L-alanine amidase
MRLVAALAVAIPMLAGDSARTLRSVTAVRHWSSAGSTRVAVEVSGDFEIRSDRLHDPERVYYDVLHSRPRFGTRRGYTELLDDPLVKRIRVAETQPGITRVVLDLGPNAEPVSSQLTNPSRLIVEVRAVATPAPAAPTVTDAAPARETAGQPQPPPVPAAPLPSKAPVKAAVPPPVADEPSKTQLAKSGAAETREPPAGPAAPAPEIRAASHESPSAAPNGRSGAAAEEVGKAARRNAGGDTSLVRALGLKINRVVIDPGHGGHDQGTQGPKGLLEKDLVLDVAKRLGHLIEERLGAEVVYTRADDTFVPLQGRTELANEKKADLFLSIHANSSPLARTAGVETYYLNVKGSSRDALDVASRENASAQQSVFDLADIIQRIAKQEKAGESREFAGRVQSALYAFSVRNVPGARDRGVRTAPFVVLIGAKMPSVLAEIGFLTNPREEALLRKSDYKQKLAEALFRGVSRYADGLSHFQMAQASASH